MQVQEFVAQVVEYVESEDAAPARVDVPVTEIPAQQLRIGCLIERRVRAAWAGDCSVELSAAPATALVLPPPTPNGLNGDAMNPRVVGVAKALV